MCTSSFRPSRGVTRVSRGQQVHTPAKKGQVAGSSGLEPLTTEGRCGRDRSRVFSATQRRHRTGNERSKESLRGADESGVRQVPSAPRGQSAPRRATPPRREPSAAGAASGQGPVPSSSAARPREAVPVVEEPVSGAPSVPVVTASHSPALLLSPGGLSVRVVNRALSLPSSSPDDDESSPSLGSPSAPGLRTGSAQDRSG